MPRRWVLKRFITLSICNSAHLTDHLIVEKQKLFCYVKNGMFEVAILFLYFYDDMILSL